MRIEATIPDMCGAQLTELANELKLSKSAIVQEAISLLVTALTGVRDGRRVALIDATSQKVISQVATPLLNQIEWTTARRDKIALTRREAKKVDALLLDPPKPTAALRKALAQHRARIVK